MTIIDERGRTIMQTGLAVHPGDELIDEDNRVYEISSVEGTLAKARYVRDEADIAVESLVIPVQAPAEPVPPPLVAIYHSHTDESYIPTDGTATQRGKGSIMQVGEAFANRLAELGLRAEHSKTLHDPHDANAYQRSRRTLAQLLKKQPATSFDIHRDSAPASVYRTTINGETVSKVLLVVGRQNQNRKTTQAYAKQIKAAADAKYRGLIRGIFIAHGNYNQDLNPRAILAEIGTQYNTLDQAKRSAALLADVVPALLAPSSKGNAPAAASPGVATDTGFPVSETSSYQDIIVIIGTLVAGTAAFLFLSTGSWREAKDKLKKFRDVEFNDLFRFRRKRR
jgi:stage II sporulation protein P